MMFVGVTLKKARLRRLRRKLLFELETLGSFRMFKLYLERLDDA